MTFTRVLLLLTLLLAGCHGGSDFHVVTLTPSEIGGMQGAPVDVEVSASGAVTRVIWNFGGGVTPNTATTPRVHGLLTGSGSFTGTVTVFEASGSSASESFTYKIVVLPHEPRITGLTPDGPEWGDIGDEITLTASADGAVTSWTWDVGEGAELLSTTASSARVRLLKTGEWLLTVTAHNGIGDSFPLTREYRVWDMPFAWRKYDLAGGILGFGELNWITYHGELVCFATRYNESSLAETGTETFILIQARSSNPVGTADWLVSDVATFEYGDWYGPYSPVAAVVGDRLAFGLIEARAYDDLRLRYSVAQSARPSSPSDWSSTDIDTLTRYEIGSFQLFDIGGLPLLISDTPPVTQFGGRGWSTTSAAPTGPGDWTPFDVPAGKIDASRLLME
ncbi:MAG: PKD domain-containing protein, partial [bacterium]